MTRITIVACTCFVFSVAAVAPGFGFDGMNGYHIITLTDRKRAETIPLSAARDKIENYLRIQKTHAAVETFVGEARKNAQIEVLL